MTGNDSYIARFQEAVTLRQEKGPALLNVDQQPVKLDAFLTKNPEMVGTIEHYKKFNKTLPFLFKILSISQPLSLQAHPDKKLAQVLHSKDPKNYPDANHKPELAIALTDFEVLCDFRPGHEIVKFMEIVLPFRRLVGDRNYEDYCRAVKQAGSDISTSQTRSSLANCFKSLMTSTKEIVTKETKILLSEKLKIDEDLLRLIKELHALHPGDPGVFGPFFLNHLKLSTGQAVYLKPNKLHAYIRGECIECMACSDNVVRAGLTPKFRDVDTLTAMLDYKTVSCPQDLLFTPTLNLRDCAVLSYAPTDEFKVDKITVTPKVAPNGEYTISHRLSGSFLVFFTGKARAKDFYCPETEHKLSLGSAAFVPPKVDLRLYNIQGTVIIYRAYC